MQKANKLASIYEQLDIPKSFPEFNCQDRGNYYSIVCPSCHKQEGYIYKTSKKIVCNRRNNCQYESTLWDYVQRKYSLNNQETLIALAQLANYPIDDSNPDYQEIEQEKRKASLLETAMSYFRSLVWENGEYLQKRGYTKEDIENMGLGYYPGKEKTVAFLRTKGYSLEQINTIETFCGEWNREDYKLVFPYRDCYGQIKTIYGRLTRALQEGEKESRKYLNFSHCEKETLFGLEYSGKEITIVEGFLDCLLAKARGIQNIVGTGSNHLTESQIENALGRGIKSFTLCLDNDQAGIEGTQKSLEKLWNKDLTCFVLTLPEKNKDLDEYLVAKGKEAFESYRSQAISGARWAAERIIKNTDLSSDKEKQECFDSLLALYKRVKKPLDKQAVKETIAVIFDKDEIEPYLERQQIQQAKEQKVQATKAFLYEMQEALENGNLDFSAFEERIKEIEIAYQSVTARPKKTQEEWLQGLYQREKEQQGQDLLGYRLGQDFLPVQKDLEGIQAGLYILGAQTNVGKTAFVANLALNLIEHNQELKIVYLSLDDNKDIIASRIRSIMAFTERSFSDRKKYEESNISINEFRKALPDIAKRQKRERINAQFFKYIQDGKLELYDIGDAPNLSDIELLVRQKANKPLVVIIDGLYNACVSENIAGKREENIERANKIKALVDTYSLPLICTAEVRKKSTGQKGEITVDDLMETGKFGYNANLVWLLYQDGKEKDDNDEMVTLSLTYAKNKLTGFKGTQEIQYYRKYAKMFVRWTKKEAKTSKNEVDRGIDELRGKP